MVNSICSEGGELCVLSVILLCDFVMFLWDSLFLPLEQVSVRYRFYIK